MTQTEVELHQLKLEVVNMWKLVSEQMKKSMTALATMDKKLAEEVLLGEKRVNQAEIDIDSHCENIFALFNPVANDLRLVLSLLKINGSLERIGDIAFSVAKFVRKSDGYNYDYLIAQTHTLEMFEEASDLIIDVMKAFETENTQIAQDIFKRDKGLNQLNRSAREFIINYIKQHPQEVEECLRVLSIFRKLERAGDQSKVIAEEIIFYIEAKVLKHSKK